MAYDEVKFIADLFRIGVELHRSGSDTDAFQVETAALEVERLLAENRLLRGRLARAEAVAKAYEQWEADLIMSDEAWKGGMAELPTLTYPLYDRMMEIQAMRNDVLDGLDAEPAIDPVAAGLAAAFGLPKEDAAADPANPPRRLDLQRRRMIRCQADDDGYCKGWDCPQVRDGEPKATGRDCPLDWDEGEDG